MNICGDIQQQQQPEWLIANGRPILTIWHSFQLIYFSICLCVYGYKFGSSAFFYFLNSSEEICMRGMNLPLDTCIFHAIYHYQAWEKTELSEEFHAS